MPLSGARVEPGRPVNAMARPSHVARRPAEGRDERRTALIYVCPVCRTPLEPLTDAFGCGSCGHTFTIREGIPDVLPGQVAGSARP